MTTSSSDKTYRIGDIAGRGDEHQGFIYGGIFPGDDKPIWVSPVAPELMTRFQSAAWARKQDAALPTIAQAAYIKTLMNEGAFKSIFNQSSTCLPKGAFWLKDRDGSAAAMQLRTRPSVFYWLHGYQREPAAALCVQR